MNNLISVIDDDDAFRKAAANLLKSNRFEVEGFASAEAFLGSPRMKETRCLILDIQMPGMSGLALQDHLVQQACQIPIIFITALGSAELREKAMQAGAVDFLPKPFSEEALLRAIHKTLI